MRRFLLALAVLLTAAVTPTFAGYIILRVLLEGSSPGGGTTPGMGGPVPPMPGGGGSLGPKPGGPPVPPPLGPTGGGMPPVPGMGDTAPAVGPGEADHTRSVVVVIPFEGKLQEAVLGKGFPVHE